MSGPRVLRRTFQCGLAARLAVAVVLAAAAAAPAAAQQPPTTVDASGGGVTISSGVNSLTIGARAQMRWTVDRREEFDGDTAGDGRGREDGALSQFDFPRLRVTLSGGVYRPWLRYIFQFDFSRTSGEGASKIKDAIIEVRPVGQPYRLMMGQFKVPFGMQQLTSSARLQFVDRAITDLKFAPGRDMGLTFNGSASGRRAGYDLGIFNGAGESNRQTQQLPLYVGRVYLDPFGVYSLAESAVDAGDEPVLHLGAAVRAGSPIRGRAAAGIVEDTDHEVAYGLELAYKTLLFYTTAEYFRATAEQFNPVPGPDLTSQGFHIQASYMLVPRRVEAGFLYAEVEGDTDLDDASVGEWRAVLGHYWQGHSLKLQADIGQLSYDANFASLSPRARAGLPGLGTRLVRGEELDDTQLRVQMTLFF